MQKRQPIIIQYANECVYVCGGGMKGTRGMRATRSMKGISILGKFLISIDNARNWSASYDILVISSYMYSLNKGPVQSFR